MFNLEEENIECAFGNREFLAGQESREQWGFFLMSGLAVLIFSDSWYCQIQTTRFNQFLYQNISFIYSSREENSYLDKNQNTTGHIVLQKFCIFHCMYIYQLLKQDIFHVLYFLTFLTHFVGWHKFSSNPIFFQNNIEMASWSE